MGSGTICRVCMSRRQPPGPCVHAHARVRGHMGKPQCAAYCVPCAMLGDQWSGWTGDGDPGASARMHHARMRAPRCVRGLPATQPAGRSAGNGANTTLRAYAVEGWPVMMLCCVGWGGGLGDLGGQEAWVGRQLHPHAWICMHLTVSAPARPPVRASVCVPLPAPHLPVSPLVPHMPSCRLSIGGSAARPSFCSRCLRGDVVPVTSSYLRVSCGGPCGVWTGFRVQGMG